MKNIFKSQVMRYSSFLSLNDLLHIHIILITSFIKRMINQIPVTFHSSHYKFYHKLQKILFSLLNMFMPYKKCHHLSTKNHKK